MTPARSILLAKSSHALINNWSLETSLDHTDMTFHATGHFNRDQQLTGDFRFGDEGKLVLNFAGNLVNLTLNGVYGNKDGGKTFR